MPFTKLTGTGNEFVIMDALRQKLSPPPGGWGAVAEVVCSRDQGIGADGLLVVGGSRVADLRMRIFNPDGSEPSMCGNGVRCLAMYAYRQGLAKSSHTIQTRAGIRRAEIQGTDRVRIDMGTPRWIAHLPHVRVGNHQAIHVDLIDSGVPHLVCWVDRVAGLAVPAVGRRLRRHRRVQPGGANVDFVEPIDSYDEYDARAGVIRRRVKIRMRTYERGVEGETRACGTGAVAAAASVICRLPHPRGLGRESETVVCLVDVQVPGGTLRVELTGKYLFTRGAVIYSRAILEGQVREVSSGTIPWNGRGAS